MSECEQLLHKLDDFGLGSWRAQLAPILDERFSEGAHGDIGKWRAVIEKLPAGSGEPGRLNGSAIATSSGEAGKAERETLKDLLRQLAPWRKGPFNINGVFIDTEWRSDLKWDRIKNEVASLAGRRVLDVGCGNGYFSLRMLGAGAKWVLGIDPMLLFMYQFFAVNHFVAADGVALLPLRLQELPEPQGCFDTTFSMGVLYHQRDPLEHLRQLRRSLRSGGELVLETLTIAGNEAVIHEPAGRYARMRNVWHLPTPPAIDDWLRQCGFRDLRLVDICPTTVDEQRSTEWMPYDSLAAALDPADPGRTVEGLPAPARAVFIATAP